MSQFSFFRYFVSDTLTFLFFAILLDSRDRGALIVMNDRICSAFYCQKTEVRRKLLYPIPDFPLPSVSSLREPGFTRRMTLITSTGQYSRHLHRARIRFPRSLAFDRTFLPLSSSATHLQEDLRHLRRQRTTSCRDHLRLPGCVHSV